jgi:hypothetical protein
LETPLLQLVVASVVGPLSHPRMVLAQPCRVGYRTTYNVLNMEVHNLLTNKVTITERNPNQPKKEQQMNWVIKLFTDIVNSPVMVWLLGTILTFLCVIVALGLHWACGLLAIWLTLSMVAYHAKRNHWGD